MIALIVGGSASGKSELAETMAMRLGGDALCYIATMQVYDEEMRAKVKRHQRLRAGKGFDTIERPLDLAGCPVPPNATILLECLSNLLANEVYDPAGAGEHAVQAILNGVDRLSRTAKHMVIVSNSIFYDGIHYNDSTEGYVQALGVLNQALAQRADMVVESVHSISVCHKGSLAGLAENGLKREGSRMELVIGGKAQGKRAYALGVARCMESDCSNDLLGDGKVLYDLQEIIRARLFEGAPEDGLHQEILAYLSRNPGCVVVCDEVGGGVVPMDSFERRWRECVGRVLCDLAQRASRVHRVFCGIGTVIKHG